MQTWLRLPKWLRFAICGLVVLVIAFAGSLAVDYFWTALKDPLPRLQGLVGLTQATLTFLGLIVAGAWWMSRREVYPRAKLDLTVEHVEVTSLGAAPRFPHVLNVVLQIENKGHVLLRTPAIRIFIRQVSPLPTIGTPPVEFGFQRTNSGREFNWPLLENGHAVFASQQIEIEPGETEVISCDVGLDTVPDVIRVYAHVENPTKSGGVGWKFSKIVRLDEKPETKPEAEKEPKTH